MKCNMTRVKAFAFTTAAMFLVSVVTAHGYVYPPWAYKDVAICSISFAFVGVIATMSIIAYDSRRW